MLALVMIVICKEQQKAVHYQKILTNRFRMIYESFFSDSYFSRYNDSLSAVFVNTLGESGAMPNYGESRNSRLWPNDFGVQSSGGIFVKFQFK